MEDRRVRLQLVQPPSSHLETPVNSFDTLRCPIDVFEPPFDGPLALQLQASDSGMVPQRPPCAASSWLRFDLNQCVVLSVFRRVGADEAAMVEDKHGRHAAFDPDSARRLCCCRDRRRAFVFGGGNDLSVDVAEARSSPLTNEQQPLKT